MTQAQSPDISVFTSAAETAGLETQSSASRAFDRSWCPRQSRRREFLAAIPCGSTDDLCSLRRANPSHPSSSPLRSPSLAPLPQPPTARPLPPPPSRPPAPPLPQQIEIASAPHHLSTANVPRKYVRSEKTISSSSVSPNSKHSRRKWRD
jgi:hypothetical protein